MTKGSRTDTGRLIQAGVLVGAIIVLYCIQTRSKKEKEGFQSCPPGTELKLENGMCCPFGIVDIANCWLKPKCPEGSFWDEQRLACYSRDPNRSDPYVLGFPMCNTLNTAGQSFVFDRDQNRCCDPAITQGPKVCDTNFICPRSIWNAKKGLCVGKTPGYTVYLQDTGPGIKPSEKIDMTLVWVFGALAVIVLGATAVRALR
jgi:hypothetical protein